MIPIPIKKFSSVHQGNGGAKHERKQHRDVRNL